MPSVTFWSKTVLIFSTVLTAYALLAVVAFHARRFMHHHQGEGGAPHHHHHCPVHHFSHLALLVGLSGMLAGCRPTRCSVRLFIVVLLVGEFVALMGISHGAARRVEMCAQQAQRVVIETSTTSTQVGGAMLMVTQVDSVSRPFTDKTAQFNCEEGVRHAAVIGMGIVAVIVLSFLTCASALRRSVAEAAEEQPATAVVPAILVIQGASQGQVWEEDAVPLKTVETVEPF